MSTFTPRLQLKRNDGSDPFKRQDFVDNWNKIDGSPGAYICTSASRPAWGAAQAGLTIVETDTRSQYQWSGTSWLPILTAPNVWQMGLSPNQTISGNFNQVIYTLGTITTSRPGTLFLDVAGSFGLSPGGQNTSLRAYVNGSEAQGDNIGYSQADAGALYLPNWAKGRAVVAAGTHTIQAKVTTGSGSNTVTVFRLAATVILGNTDHP